MTDAASPQRQRLIILGSGPAGCTAAIYAARANLKPLLVTGVEQGGQLTTTTDVENWPGGEDRLQGPALMASMAEHVQRFDASWVVDQVQEADLGARPMRLVGESGEYRCDALIIATGASARYLGLESESRYRGRGVSSCATCDGFFFRDQDVAVVGGGNTAAEEALYLSRIARSVTVVHRREALRAERILQDRLFAKERERQLRFAWNQTVVEVLGDGNAATGLALKSALDGHESTLDVSGVFIAIGHTPNTGIFENQLDMRDGYLTVAGGTRGNATATSHPGVFAAGDVMDSHYRQAVTSAGNGCMAALDAVEYLSKTG